jgi:hypothetical protein
VKNSWFIPLNYQLQSLRPSDGSNDEKIIESKYQIFILCEHTNLIDYSSDENLTIG